MINFQNAVILFVVLVLTGAFYSLLLGKEEFEERNCTPIKGMYYKTRSGHLASILKCDAYIKGSKGER